MKRRIQKGEIGYYRAQGKREWIKTLLLFCIAFGLLLTGMLISRYRNPEISFSQSKYNLLTVAAVLGVLPAARSLISAIMFSRAKKHSCPDELKEKIGADCMPVFELYLTEEKEAYPLFAAVCTDKEVLGLLDGDQQLAGRGEAHIQKALQMDGKKNVTVKLFTTEKSFLDRVGNIKDAGEQEAAQELVRLLYQISL